MATTVAFEDDILKLIFNATPIVGIAEDATTTPATEYFVSLHSEDPLINPSPVQTSGEINYTAYARQAVTRDATGWEVSGGICRPEETIEFPVVAGVTSPVQATHFGVGTLITGAGKLLFAGKLEPALGISNGAEPRIDNQAIAARFESSWA